MSRLRVRPGRPVEAGKQGLDFVEIHVPYGNDRLREVVRRKWHQSALESTIQDVIGRKVNVLEANRFHASVRSSGPFPALFIRRRHLIDETGKWVNELFDDRETQSRLEERLRTLLECEWVDIISESLASYASDDYSYADGDQDKLNAIHLHNRIVRNSDSPRDKKDPRTRKD